MGERSQNQKTLSTQSIAFRHTKRTAQQYLYCPTASSYSPSCQPTTVTSLLAQVLGGTGRGNEGRREGREACPSTTTAPVHSSVSCCMLFSLWFPFIYVLHPCRGSSAEGQVRGRVQLGDKEAHVAVSARNQQSRTYNLFLPYTPENVAHTVHNRQCKAKKGILGEAGFSGLVHPVISDILL